MVRSCRVRQELQNGPGNRGTLFAKQPQNGGGGGGGGASDGVGQSVAVGCFGFTLDLATGTGDLEYEA